MMQDLSEFHRGGRHALGSDSTSPDDGEWHYAYRDLIAVHKDGNTGYVELFYREGQAGRVHWSVLADDGEQEGFSPALSTAIRRVNVLLGIR